MLGYKYFVVHYPDLSFQPVVDLKAPNGRIGRIGRIGRMIDRLIGVFGVLGRFCALALALGSF